MIAASVQPLSAQVASYDGGIVVDVTQPGYSEGGAWTPQYSWYLSGQSLTPVHQTEAPGSWAQWTAKIPAAGKYRVYFWHIPNRETEAKIEIGHDGQTETLTRNVAFGHLGWTSLGDYDFAAGENGFVKFMHDDTKELIVNSVKFLPVADIPPLPSLPPYPKPDGSFPRIDSAGNMILSGVPYQIFYQELQEETTAHPEVIATNLDETFDIARAQGVNTLGTTIYWRTFEPTPGAYDYTILDALIEKARARHMHLSLILFFAWRNLQSYYLPEYIAKDPATYWLVTLPDGKPDPHRKVSPFADATRAAETKALTALFQRVLEKDPDHQVVLLAQIENEMPSWRDYSAPALAAWNAPVPQALMDFLGTHEGSINRLVWDDWQAQGHKTAGTWAEVFGNNDKANRFFGVWSAGRYIQALVTDLKKVINLPFYMNAWMGESPCTYTYMDIFHASAPVLDAMGPDAYGTFATWESDVGLSVRSWNHMVIPEENHTAESMWRAIGNYDALINGQWRTVEGLDWLDCRETCDLIGTMAPLIAAQRGTGDMWGFYQGIHALGESWSDYFQDLKITYTATAPSHAPLVKLKAPTPGDANLKRGELDGCGLLIALGGGEYVLTSTRLDIALAYIKGGPITVTDAQAGHFDQGTWISEGPATVEQKAEEIRFHFPTENRRYGQIRFKLSSTARNPARVFEAERGTYLKRAAPTFNAGASGAFGVTDIRGAGAGVEFANNAGFAAGGLTIRYACGAPMQATVFINGQKARDIDFPATGPNGNSSWTEKSIALDVPVGATFSIQAGPRETAPDLDCVMLSRDAPSPAPAAAAP